MRRRETAADKCGVKLRCLLSPVWRVGVGTWGQCQQTSHNMRVNKHLHKQSVRYLHLFSHFPSNLHQIGTRTKRTKVQEKLSTALLTITFPSFFVHVHVASVVLDAGDV